MIRIEVCGLNDDCAETVQIIEKWLNKNDIEHSRFEMEQKYGFLEGGYTIVDDTCFQIRSNDEVLYKKIAQEMRYQYLDVKMKIIHI